MAGNSSRRSTANFLIRNLLHEMAYLNAVTNLSFITFFSKQNWDTVLKLVWELHRSQNILVSSRPLAEKSHNLNRSYKGRVTATLLTRYGVGKNCHYKWSKCRWQLDKLYLIHSACDVKLCWGSYYSSRWTERKGNDLWPDLISAHFHTGYYAIRITSHSLFLVLFYVLGSEKVRYVSF